MSSKTLVSNRKYSIPLVVCATLVLAGCDENGAFMFPQSGQAAANGEATAPNQSIQMVERDVEAPEAFEVTEAGLWDGRPSLGGVWVAHPDVAEPERVIIRNQANGTFVIGALFRRERENPGPALQVSSDAAAALEMLAGAPSQLQVTALRREEVAETPATEAVAQFDAPSEIAAAPIDAGPIDTGAVDVGSIETAGLDVTPAAAAVGATRLVVPDPIAAAAAAIDAAEADLASAPVGTPAETVTPVASPIAVPAPTVAPIPATPTPTPVAANLAKPFIQIGIFSVEDNATATANRMRAAGIVPTVLAQESQGRPFWRVIVGPTTSESERAELLRLVKAEGFEDAYFVTN